MRQLLRRRSAVLALTAMALGLSACAGSAELTRASDEIKARGFEDVQHLKEDTDSQRRIFTAKFGSCRVEIASRKSDGSLEFVTLKLSDEQKARLAAAGGGTGDMVNASYLNKYAEILGYKHCIS